MLHFVSIAVIWHSTDILDHAVFFIGYRASLVYVLQHIQVGMGFLMWPVSQMFCVLGIFLCVTGVCDDLLSCPSRASGAPCAEYDR